MEPYVIKNFFSEDLMDLLRFQVSVFKSEAGPGVGVENDREVFFRKQVHNPHLFRALHALMKKRACETFGEEVKPSYVFVSMYDDDRAICPLHTDREQCKYTIDLCLDQKEPWEIFINDVAYLLEPGDAVVYSGTDHPHYRNRIAKGNFCDLAFFHFVPKSFSGGLD